MEFLSRQTVRLPRWAIFVSPGRIHLTGRHVGDIAAERDGDVPGRGGGPAEMDGDVLRDDDPVQHPRHTGEGRGRAAAAVAGEEAVGWDDDGDVGRVPHLLGVGTSSPTRSSTLLSGSRTTSDSTDSLTSCSGATPKAAR